MARTCLLVMSLVSNGARREQFAADAAATSLPWRFFDGFRAPVPPLTYDRELSILRSGRPLGPGEIGCFTSHYKAWEDFLASDNDQAIILEDDVIVDWPVLEKLVAWNCTEHGIDLLRLYATHPFEYKTMVHRFLSPHSHLVRVRGWHHGSQGYLITRRSAQALMAAATTSIYAPVDWIIAGYWTFGLPAYCLFPFPLLERSVPSSVGETREEAFTMSPAQKAKYLAWKVRNRMQRAKVDASLAWQNPFPPTGDVGQAFVDRATPQPARNTQRHRQMASRSDPTRPDAVLDAG